MIGKLVLVLVSRRLTNTARLGAQLDFERLTAANNTSHRCRRRRRLFGFPLSVEAVDY